MFRLVLITLFFISYLGIAQDYSKKNFASIHQYAERMLGNKIVASKDGFDRRKGTLFYYKELDIPGNYAHVSGGYAGDYHLALWKMKNGNDLVGITHNNCQASCIYECSFFEFSQTDSVEISSHILPLSKMLKHLKKIKVQVVGASGDIDNEEAQFKFIMPRMPGLLVVQISMDRNKIEFPILELAWNGEKFAIKTKYKEAPDL